MFYENYLTLDFHTNTVMKFKDCIAQLVEHCTGITEVMGSNPVQARANFFQAFKGKPSFWSSLVSGATFTACPFPRQNGGKFLPSLLVHYEVMFWLSFG